MNLDLSEFVGTLCIGGGIIFLAIIMLRVYCCIELFQLFERLDGRLLGNTFLLTIAAFALGMIAEDVSDNYVDTDGQFFQTELNFPHEADLRFQVFFGHDSNCSKENKKQFELGRLAKLYARLDLIREHNPEFGTSVQSAVKNDIPVSTINGHGTIDAVCEELKDLTNSIYYHAKNVVYNETNYFRELSLIQNRIDFARSVAVLSIVFICVILVAFTVRSAVLLVPLPMTDYDASWIAFRNTFQSSIYLAFLAGLVFVASRHAYAAEEREFDRRAFGYYGSLKQEAVLSRTDRTPAIATSPGTDE